MFSEIESQWMNHSQHLSSLKKKKVEFPINFVLSSQEKQELNLSLNLAQIREKLLGNKKLCKQALFH